MGPGMRIPVAATPPWKAADVRASSWLPGGKHTGGPAPFVVAVLSAAVVGPTARPIARWPTVS